MTITDHGRSDRTAIDMPIAGRREWIGLMVLGLANLLYVMDLTVLKLAVPANSVGLQPSGTQLLWIIDISGFFLFQDPRQRSLAVGTWIGAFSAGGALGPAVGGLLLELFWWGSVFLVALPVTALLLVLGPRVLWSLPSAFGFIVGSQLGPRLAGRVRPANTIAAGLALGGGRSGDAHPARRRGPTGRPRGGGRGGQGHHDPLRAAASRDTVGDKHWGGEEGVPQGGELS